MPLVFLCFCLTDFIINFQSKVNIISNSNWALYQYQISSPELTPEATFVEMWEGNSRKIERGDLSWVLGKFPSLE